MSSRKNLAAALGGTRPHSASGSESSDRPPKGGLVIGFKVAESDGERCLPGNDDDVEAVWWSDTPEDLADSPLRPVALDGPAQPSGRRDAEPRRALAAGSNEHRQRSAVDLDSLIVDTPVLGTLPDPAVSPKRLIHQEFGDHHRAGMPGRSEAGLRRRETLAAPCPAAFQHQPARARTHPHQESVGPPPLAPIRLKCPFHSVFRGWPPASHRAQANGNDRRSRKAVSNLTRLDLRLHRIASLDAVCYSAALPFDPRASPQSFPQLWKNLWKCRR